MAVVFPHRRLMAIPMPSEEQYTQLDNLFVTYTLPRENGRSILVLPHHSDALRILDNMGINTEGCDMFSHYYQPPTQMDGSTVWWWQLETARFLTQHNYAFVTSTPRTGKTLSTLLAVDFIQREVGGKALIVAPLTVANDGAWHDECRRWLPHKKVVLVHKDRQSEINEDADIYLINPEGLKIIHEQVRAKVDKREITIAVFDELTEFANVKSQRWLAARNATMNCLYRWGLTGTPGSPEKIYGQVKLINPSRVPSSYYQWRDKTMIEVTKFKWIPKHGHEEIVKDAMSPCIRFDKDQLMTIPIPQVITEEVPLSETQQKVVKQLQDEFMAVIEGEAVEAITASTLAQKMLQVSGGTVRNSKGGYSVIDAKPKLDKLLELLNRTDRKKVVFSSFTATNDMLVDFIRANGFTCEKIDGSVTGGKRSQILKDFLNADTPHVLVCHPRTTAFGVELASADMIICYGVPLTGAFMYQQMFERLSSSRQTAKETFVVHLSAGRQDKLSFDALAKGVNIERTIVNLFTKDIMGGD